jgi:hypothetical protein
MADVYGVPVEDSAAAKIMVWLKEPVWSVATVADLVADKIEAAAYNYLTTIKED